MDILLYKYKLIYVFDLVKDVNDIIVRLWCPMEVLTNEFIKFCKLYQSNTKMILYDGYINGFNNIVDNRMLKLMHNKKCELLNMSDCMLIM
jgi:hypothetical protein